MTARVMNRDRIALLSQLVRAGWSNDDIGRSLGLERGTVAYYRHKLRLPKYAEQKRKVKTT